MGKAYVIGAGVTKFDKPQSKSGDYPDWVKEAVGKALEDAKIDYSKVEQVFAGYVYGDSGSGQRAIQEVGLTGIPIFNVNNKCSSSSSALVLAKEFIELGKNDCILTFGFEKIEKGSKLGPKYLDRADPIGNFINTMGCLTNVEKDISQLAQIFGNAGLEHMKKYGTKAEHFAKIAWKNHKHSVNNPNAQFQTEYSLEEVLNSPKIFGPLTRLQCCPFSNGASAVVVASERFVKKHNLQSQAIEILGMEMATDRPSTFNENSFIKLIGYDIVKEATNRLFQKAKRDRSEVQVIELHDCFATNELIAYEALGLCPPGKAGEFVDRGDNTYGGKYVINPSGGLTSRGHPLGATGLAQCAELCWQLRGVAGKRQVPGATLALQHNIGLGCAMVVALYQRGVFT